MSAHVVVNELLNTSIYHVWYIDDLTSIYGELPSSAARNGWTNP